MAKTNLSSITGPVEPGQYTCGWYMHGQMFVRFIRRDYSFTNHLLHTALAGGWKFVGASHDRKTGDAKLRVNGAVVQTLNIGAGLDLATQDSVRMSVKSGDGRFFKGRIAQMQVYNTALTQRQIQAIKQKPKVVGEYLTGHKLLRGSMNVSPTTIVTI